MPIWSFRRRRWSATPATQQGDRNNTLRGFSYQRRAPTPTREPAVCPKPRGERETLAWMNRDSSHTVNAILRARDYASHNASFLAASPRHDFPGTPEVTKRSSDRLYMNVPEEESNAIRQGYRSLPISHQRQTQRVQSHGETRSPPGVISSDPRGFTLIAPVTVYASEFSLPSNSEGSLSRHVTSRETEARIEDPHAPVPRPVQRSVITVTGYSSSDSEPDSDDDEDVPGPTVKGPPAAGEPTQNQQQEQKEEQEKEQFGEWVRAIADAIEPDPTMGPSTSLSEQGQTRLVIIREALSMDPDTPAGDIQLFLGNNISLIRHLVFGTVPHPDWQYRSGPELFEMRVWNRASHARNCRLWSAITGVYWEDVRIRDVMDMALHQMAGQNGWLLTRALRKTRRDTLPGELRTRLLAEEPGFGVQERLRFEEIGRKRRNRPGSLLREAVPQDE